MGVNEAIREEENRRRRLEMEEEIGVIRLPHTIERSVSITADTVGLRESLERKEISYDFIIQRLLDELPQCSIPAGTDSLRVDCIGLVSGRRYLSGPMEPEDINLVYGECSDGPNLGVVYLGEESSIINRGPRLSTRALGLSAYPSGREEVGEDTQIYVAVVSLVER